MLLSALPTVATGAASSITLTGATLNGLVNPNGSTTTALFQYSTSPLFTPTVASTIGSGYNQPVGAAVACVGDIFVAEHLHLQSSTKVLPSGHDRDHRLRVQHTARGVAVDAAGDVGMSPTSATTPSRRCCPQRPDRDHRLRVQRPVRRGGGRGRRRVRRRLQQQYGQGGASQRHHQDHRAWIFATRWCGGRSRRRLRRNLRQQRQMLHRVLPKRARQTPSAPVSTSRVAWRWTPLATSSSPTPATLPSTRCSPTARSTRLGPGTPSRPAWRWTRPAMSSSPTGTTCETTNSRRRR